MGTITKFTELNAWREGHKLVLIIYKITNQFPEKERFSLTNQMQRAAVSITSNIAEGFGRRGKQEKMQFYYMAQGSLSELQNQLLISKDLGYLKKDKFEETAELTVTVHKLLTGLIKSIRNKE
ncbi:hypothetical protein A2803_03240 [Candidatus Woesebacteria bacterium RIFCSPHIGHO2_01_FULL_44_21]|uniref:Four helix bundle protein n=1 Tax=Candidatus Woesebacteria bacterium RIFCSPHIGHO2_01_FULL_44_21 TaxID=1802503 RepID=A0A1F7Z046_9BACT|nr:MAG: hypothetical protein A2803_03240 [Candidatus Woesebacteria bacterium RIFCSPHIGHO2_01_FULL_44_21]OGM69151.1 MAG: hypothetical protein A2897_05000 [Candidatus Woesebacteria bacterium RIFCSPLOWO2_01_FULL_44_24b]